MERSAQIVRDAREHGVEVREIDVNHSDWDCTLEALPHQGEGKVALRLGLRQVEGLQRYAADRLTAAKPYASVEDLQVRVGMPVHAIQRLAAADAFVCADALAAAMADEKFDLVLTGLQSDDQGHGQTGVVLAERLGIPHSTIIMEVQVQGEPVAGGQASGATVRVKRELEGGWFQWITLPLPALLTIQSGINQLRYATLKGIMAAKKKEIRTVAPPSGLQASQEIVALAVPARQKRTAIIGGTPEEAARELVRRLRDEARAL